MGINKIEQLVSSLQRIVDDSEKIATPVLAVKLAKCLEAYPEDKTLGAMARVIDKMADNNTTFIKKSELKQLYSKLYSSNTKFAQLFSEELGIKDEIKKENLDNKQNYQDNFIDTYSLADPLLSNALDSVFDKNAPIKLYSKVAADKAKNIVKDKLEVFNAKASNINVDAGNEKFIIVKADYDTPKGLTSFYVPIEVSGNKVSEATMFMANSGPQDFNNKNIKDYVKTFAGSKLKISGENLLNLLVEATSEKREISGAEMALMRLNASKQTKSDFFENQIVGLNLEKEAKKDVELMKSDEFKSFEEKFASAYGQAAFNFGEDKIKIARENIARDLIAFGYKNAQITITSSDNNSIFYGVSLDAGKVAFTVPVKINAGKIQKPTVMICNGSISTLDKGSINKLYINNQTDYKVAAAASPLFNLKASDLVNAVRDAMNEGNIEKAEDALNVLSNNGDEKAYAIAFTIYRSGLGIKQASHNHADGSKCSLIIKSATSQHPVCGHTGLPIHKVYQDDHGNCRPMYRKGMDESYEGASFMNAKIFG